MLLHPKDLKTLTVTKGVTPPIHAIFELPDPARKAIPVEVDLGAVGNSVWYIYI